MIIEKVLIDGWQGWKETTRLPMERTNRSILSCQQRANCNREMQTKNTIITSDSFAKKKNNWLPAERIVVVRRQQHALSISNSTLQKTNLKMVQPAKCLDRHWPAGTHVQFLKQLKLRRLNLKQELNKIYRIKNGKIGTYSPFKAQVSLFSTIHQIFIWMDYSVPPVDISHYSQHWQS